MFRTPFSHDITRHPVFVREARRVRWGTSHSYLKHYSWRLVLLVQPVSFGLWACIMGLIYLLTPPYLRSRDYWPIEAGFNAANLLILSAIAANLVLDFFSTQAAIHSISGEINAGRWDLLRLTALHGIGIARAKHAAAQLRVWRGMMIAISVRLATVWMLVLVYLVLLTYDTNFFTGLLNYPIETIFFILVLCLTGAIYVMEPYWRMKAMTTLGLMVSTYEWNIPLALLAATALIFAVWLAQFVIAASLIFGLGLFAPVFFISPSPVFGLVYLLLSVLVTGLTIYGFYALVQSWGLRRVIWRISREGDAV